MPSQPNPADAVRVHYFRLGDNNDHWYVKLKPLASGKFSVSSGRAGTNSQQFYHHDFTDLSVAQQQWLDLIYEAIEGEQTFSQRPPYV